MNCTLKKIKITYVVVTNYFCYEWLRQKKTNYIETVKGKIGDETGGQGAKKISLSSAIYHCSYII